MSNGEMSLAEAMSSMTHSNFGTQIICGDALVSTGLGYVLLLENCSKNLAHDQENCSLETEKSATGDPKAAIGAVEAHTKYQIASTQMNHEMGTQNSLLNTEQVMEHMQSHNLVPVYSTMEYVALIFLNTSGEISGF